MTKNLIDELTYLVQRELYFWVPYRNTEKTIDKEFDRCVGLGAMHAIRKLADAIVKADGRRVD